MHQQLGSVSVQDHGSHSTESSAAITCLSLPVIQLQIRLPPSASDRKVSRLPSPASLYQWPPTLGVAYHAWSGISRAFSCDPSFAILPVVTTSWNKPLSHRDNCSLSSSRRANIDWIWSKAGSPLECNACTSLGQGAQASISSISAWRASAWTCKSFCSAFTSACCALRLPREGNHTIAYSPTV